MMAVLLGFVSFIGVVVFAFAVVVVCGMIRSHQRYKRGASQYPVGVSVTNEDWLHRLEQELEKETEQ